MTDTGENETAAEEPLEPGDDGQGMLAVHRQDGSMTTRDGVRLDADLWMPEGDGPYPVLLMRTPFGRRRADTHAYAHPAWYAEQGYIVVVQDVRGTGSSGGTFEPFTHEAADGADAVAWAASLAGSSGAVGLYGCGYAGVAQLLALSEDPPARTEPEGIIRAAAPAFAGWDLREDWISEGGTPRMAETVALALLVGLQQASRAGDAAAVGRIAAAIAVWRSGGVAQCMADWPDLPYVGDGPLRSWLDGSGHAADWSRWSPHARLRGREWSVPTLHVGGWHDGKLAGTINAFTALAEQSVDGARQHLVVGPWSGDPWALLAGTIDVGASGERPLDRLQLAWFDHWLKGVDLGLDDDDPVHLFDLGRRSWESFPALPEPAPEALYLGSTGLAASAGDDGELSADYPEETAIDRILHDPLHPVPAWGGHGGLPRGMRQRSRVDARGDVATYATPSVDAAVALVGAVELVLYAGADAPVFDICAVLSVVGSDGRATELTHGFRRVDAGEPGPYAVDMGYTCATVRAGQRLRLSLAGSSVPAYPVGDGASAAGSGAGGTEPVLIEIASGSAGPSHLLVRTQ